MQIPFYQVDAFAERPFEGNPAAVCPLDAPLDETVMQSIAAEANVSETAFLTRGGGEYSLRWFTPLCEVDLCGHATLASAHIVFTKLDPGRESVSFETRSGRLTVNRGEGRLVMGFPAMAAKPIMVPAGLGKALGAQPMEVRQSKDDWMAVMADADVVRAVKPDARVLAEFPFRGLIVTAKGDSEDVDFVSRFFAPAVGIDEDPVTGAAHCVSAPYWAVRLKRDALTARQVSKRGGTVYCRVRGEDRVDLAGSATTVLEGTLMI